MYLYILQRFKATFKKRLIKTLVTYLAMFSSIALGAQNNLIFHGGVSDGFAMSCVGSAIEVAMPVELILFSASCNHSTATIHWRTASEHNSAYFTLERSTTGAKWEMVTRINAIGNSTHLTCYSFTDKNNLSRRVYYRLRQTDINEDFLYSNMVVLENCKEKASNFRVYPNPTTGRLNLVFKGDINRVQRVEIANILGEVVFVSDHMSASLDLTKLKSGIYFIRLNLFDHSLTQKIVIESKD